jgi:hypothetical protein
MQEFCIWHVSQIKAIYDRLSAPLARATRQATGGPTGRAKQTHHAAALAILGLPYAVSRASIRACPIPELISALPQSFENGRHSTMSALAPRSARVPI